MLQFSPIVQQVIPKNAGKRSTFHVVIISNILSVILHLTRELPIPDDNGFIYGHHTLQVIGQQQLSNKYYLLLLDILVFYLQLALFTSQYTSKKHKTIRSSLVESEYDGFQGETIALKIPLISAMHLPFPSIEELKLEEEEMENETNNNNDNEDSLMVGQPAYGSISNNNNNMDDEDGEDSVL